MEKKIQGEEVVITTKVDLLQYINDKKDEIDLIEQDEVGLKQRKKEILDELELLVNVK